VVDAAVVWVSFRSGGYIQELAVGTQTIDGELVLNTRSYSCAVRIVVARRSNLGSAMVWASQANMRATSSYTHLKLRTCIRAHQLSAQCIKCIKCTGGKAESVTVQSDKSASQNCSKSMGRGVQSSHMA
jgi:hypothetical protein